MLSKHQRTRSEILVDSGGTKLSAGIDERSIPLLATLSAGVASANKIYPTLRRRNRSGTLEMYVDALRLFVELGIGLSVGRLALKLDS